MKLVAICFLGLSMTGLAQSQQHRKFPLVSISGLKNNLTDTIQLKAYVMDIYVCPPCPQGMQCKPCIENNLTVVEEKPVNVLKIPLDKRLRIFTAHPDSLKMNKRYRFIVRFRNKKTNPSDNVELISFQPL